MPAQPALVLGRTDQGDHTMVTMTGEIDMDSLPALRALIEDCLRDGIRVIDVDVSALTFCDVTGLNFFLAAQYRTLGAGAELHLHDPGPFVIRLLDLTGTRAHLTESPIAPGREAMRRRGPDGLSLARPWAGGTRAGVPLSRLCRGWGGHHLR